VNPRPALIAIALAGLSAAPPAAATPPSPAAAATPERACAGAEAKQFDFWLGEWDLTWENGRGTNTITRALDGCVIMENFNGGTSMPLRGMSLSVWSNATGAWQQTWVDNEGGYLDFSGGLQKDGRMILERKGKVEGKEVLQRMIWHDIRPSSLVWNWERSEDGGVAWKVVWRIAYRRRAGGPRS